GGERTGAADEVHPFGAVVGEKEPQLSRAGIGAHPVYCPGSTCASGRSVRDVDHGGLAGTRDAHEVLVEGVAVLAGRKDSGARPRDGGVGIGTARELIGYESTPGKGGPPAFPGGRVGERVIERREVRQRESEHVRGPVEVEAAAVAAAGEVG